MASPLRPQLLRLATRRLSTVRNQSSRSILTVAGDRGSLVSSSRWTTNEESPHCYSLSSCLRSFSTTNEEEKTTEPPTTTDDIIPKEEEARDLHKESLQFQAETKQLLDIVTHSLYTDKEGKLSF